MADGTTFAPVSEQDVRREILARAWTMRHVARARPGTDGLLLRTIHTDRLLQAARLGRERRRAIKELTQ